MNRERGARAVFLDRDGTLIEDTGYPNNPDSVSLLAGVGEALDQLKAQGFLLILVSNQSGIGRGLVTPEAAEEVHRRMTALLRSKGVELDGAYYCWHTPEQGCGCRKPAPGMVLQAANDFGLNLSCCFLVGDKESDLEAGRQAGCKTIFLSSGQPADGLQAEPEAIARDWRQVLEKILAVSGATPICQTKR
jgi:histidinol-phosphate phosphatase family protein